MAQAQAQTRPASLALTCAFLCSYAYHKGGLPPGRYVPRTEYAWRWEGVHSGMEDWERYTCPGSDVQALFAYRPSDATVFVAFRGTDSVTDALLDAAVVKRALPYMMDTDPAARVHAGFLAQYRAAAGPVSSYLRRHPGRARTVVTGHSLGGAVATLCAAQLVDEGSEGAECHVFGSPRVGNAEFARRVDELLEVRRHVVGFDPVASVPSRVRWRHAGKRLWYVGGERVAASGGDGWPGVFAVPNLLCLPDHDLAGYIDCVAGDCGAEPSKRWWRKGASGLYLAWLAAFWGAVAMLR